MPTPTRSGAASLTALAILALSGSASPVVASSVPGKPHRADVDPALDPVGPPPTWSLTASPAADVWFGSLAIVGFHGFGPFPLYDPAYVDVAGSWKRARRIPATSLERQAARFLQAFEGDSAFEVLHFVPLYFPLASPDEMLTALERVAKARTGSPSAPTAGTRFGTGVVASVLASPDQRQVLGEFVAAVRAEWEGVVQPWLEETAPARERRLGAIREGWGSRYEAALAPYLAARNLRNGLVIVSPALGREGRFFEGDPADPSDNVIAVGTIGRSPDESLSSLVRELCYPAVRQAFEEVEPRYPDRVEAARASDRAAVRCGELLLAAYAPERLPAYRSTFLPGAGPGELPVEVDPALDAALLAALQRN